MREILTTIIGDLAFDTKIKGGETRTDIAGGAYGCAVGASKFSDRVGLVAEVGPDFDLGTLARRKIDVQGVKVNPEKNTPHFQLVIEDDGRRTMISASNIRDNIDTASFPPDYLSSLFFHLATSHPNKHLAWIEYLKGRKCASTNTGTGLLSADIFEIFAKLHAESTHKVISSVGLLFLNEEEHKILAEFGTVTYGIPCVLKKGNRGAVYIDGEQYIEVPAKQVKTVDTTGAGDVLAGAFLALRSEGYEIGTALKIAVDLASQSVTVYGLEHI